MAATLSVTVCESSRPLVNNFEVTLKFSKFNELADIQSSFQIASMSCFSALGPTLHRPPSRISTGLGDFMYEIWRNLPQRSSTYSFENMASDVL